MSLEGSIKDFGLSDIFQLIYVQQKSGLMSIEDGDRRAGVGFVKGMVVSAQMDGNEGIERIGEVLVRAKRITRPQLDRALKIQEESGDHLGRILVSQQSVSEEDLKKALRLQTLETVYRLFRWKAGRYSFDQRDIDYPKQYIDPISTEHILMEGVRRLDEWPPIEKRIPSLQIVFRQVPERRTEIEQTPPPAAPKKSAEDDPFADLDPEPEGRFSAHEISVYQAVNGSHTVSELIELLQIGEFEVCKALANLLNAGLIAPLSMPSIMEAPEELGTLSELAKHASTAFCWVLNLVFMLGLIGLPAWMLWSAQDTLARIGSNELVALNIVLLPNQLKGIREIVEVWRAEHGEFPASVFDPLAAYGAADWSLKDPWGNPWSYDPRTGKVGVGAQSPEQ